MCGRQRPSLPHSSPLSSEAMRAGDSMSPGCAFRTQHSRPLTLDNKLLVRTICRGGTRRNRWSGTEKAGREALAMTTYEADKSSSRYWKEPSPILLGWLKDAPYDAIPIAEFVVERFNKLERIDRKIELCVVEAQG